MKKRFILLSATLWAFALFGIFAGIHPANAGTTNVTVNNKTGDLNFGLLATGIQLGYYVPSGYNIEFKSGSVLTIDAGATVNGITASATPAGASGSIQYNNSGTTGGTSGMIWNGSLLQNTQTTNGLADLFGIKNSSSGTAAQAEIKIQNNNADYLALKFTGGSFSGPSLTGGPSGTAASIFTNSTAPISLGVNATEVERITGAGVAIIGTLSASGGLAGTATNDSAAAGYVGQRIDGVQSSAQSLSTGVGLDVISISLTAGDWEVSGRVYFLMAPTTTVTAMASWISTSSATYPGLVPSLSAFNFPIPAAAGNAIGIPNMPTRISLATTTTVYLSCAATFGTSTVDALGNIHAIRVR